MKRERLMSGQRWYFDEDGTAMTLDLVIDIWDLGSCKETGRVMIGGFWYDESMVQEMVSGRRNSFYEIKDKDSVWCHERVSIDIKMVIRVIDKQFGRYSYDELEDDAVLSQIAASVKEELSGPLDSGYIDDDGFLVIGNVRIFVENMVTARRDIKKTVTMF